MLGRGERTLQDVIRLYEEKGEIAESDDANRGRGYAKWVYGPRGFSNNVIAAIKQRMEEALSSKDTVRAGWMCEWLANEFNLSVSRRVLPSYEAPDRGKLGQVSVLATGGPGGPRPPGRGVGAPWVLPQGLTRGPPPGGPGRTSPGVRLWFILTPDLSGSGSCPGQLPWVLHTEA